VVPGVMTPTDLQRLHMGCRVLMGETEAGARLNNVSANMEAWRGRWWRECIGCHGWRRFLEAERELRRGNGRGENVEVVRPCWGGRGEVTARRTMAAIGSQAASIGQDEDKEIWAEWA
jgi:hypothetical protein